MNQKTAKMIRKYAKLRNIGYSRCKTVYLKGSPDDQALYRSEMNKAFDAPDFPVRRHEDLPTKSIG